MVEGGGLENRCAGNCTVGSNPTLSATYRNNPTSGVIFVSKMARYDKLKIMNSIELFVQSHQYIAFSILLALVIWTTVWKGLALWKSARISHRWWFIILLVVNTLGILEIFYLFVFSKKDTREE